MKDNSVIRLNMITAIECISQNTVSEKYAKRLQRKYPDYVTLKKNNPVEIQLHDIECKILE
jgi:DNA-directed RNA polymerase subunit K/omega